jgi:hypothetical protein
MTLEEMQAKIAELEAKQGQSKPTRFTDNLSLPEDLTSESLKEILEKFEDHLQAQYKKVGEEAKKTTDAVRREQEKREFDQQVAEFQKTHPDLFDKNNEAYLDILNTFFQKESSKGVATKEALEKAYESLTKTSSYKPPTPEGEKKKEEPPKEVNPFGTIHPTDSLKTQPGEIQKTAPKDIRTAVTDTLAQMKAEGLSFPSSQ